MKEKLRSMLNEAHFVAERAQLLGMREGGEVDES